MGTSLDKVSREISAVGAAAGMRLLELTDEISKLLPCDIPNYAATTSPRSRSARGAG